MAMLTLGDGPPAPVIFDTGTDENLLQKSFVDRLKLKHIGSSKMIDGTNGAVEVVPVVALSKPRLSGASVRPATAQVFNSHERDTVGIFGPQSFSGQVLTLELGLHRFTLSALDPTLLPQRPATPHVNGVAAVTISVGGMPLTAVLDSGATAANLTISRALMDKVPLKGPVSVIGKVGSVSNLQDVYAGQIDGDVTIGPLHLHDPKVNFIDLMEDANIGLPLMRNLTVVIDPAGKRSWVLDPHVDVGPLASYAGTYGGYVVTAEGDKLAVQGKTLRLYYAPLGSGLFANSETGNRIQFRRRGDKALGFTVIRSDGSVTNAARSDRD